MLNAFCAVCLRFVAAVLIVLYAAHNTCAIGSVLFTHSRLGHVQIQSSIPDQFICNWSGAAVAALNWKPTTPSRMPSIFYEKKHCRVSLLRIVNIDTAMAHDHKTRHTSRKYVGMALNYYYAHKISCGCPLNAKFCDCHKYCTGDNDYDTKIQRFNAITS